MRCKNKGVLLVCGRFALATEKHILEILYDLELRGDLNLLKPRYNIAPSQQILGLRLSDEGAKRELAALKWGLVPFWAKDPSIGSQMINARAETAAQKPSFREALKKRRILIPVSGFYEWKKETGGSKQPYYITRKDGALFSLAGLWERWSKGKPVIESATILTTEPNELIAALHNRMPLIISPENYQQWLDLKTDPDQINALLRPAPVESFTAYPVSTLVNKPVNDNPDLIIPK